MKSEHGQQLGFREGMKIAGKVAQSSRDRGYFETMTGNMDDIPEIKGEDIRPAMAGLYTGLFLRSPELVFGLGRSVVNLLKKHRG